MLNFSFFFTLFLCALTALGQKLNIPAASKPVMDEARVFSAQTATQLDGVLLQFKKQTGIQFGILTTESLQGVSIEEYSIAVADQWRLGDQATDRALILVVAPSERKVRLEVGQGLEGEFPDVRASRVIREVIVPKVRSEGLEAALVSGVQEILGQLGASSEQLQAPVSRPRQKSSAGVFVVFFLYLLVMFLRGSHRRRGLAPLGVFGGGSGWSGGGFGGGGGWSGGGGGFSGGGASGGW